MEITDMSNTLPFLRKLKAWWQATLIAMCSLWRSWWWASVPFQYQPNSLPNNLQLSNCPRTWLRHSRGFWGEIDMFLEGFRMEIGLLHIWQCPQNYWGWIFYSGIILHSERLAGNYMLFFSLDQLSFHWKECYFFGQWCEQHLNIWRKDICQIVCVLNHQKCLKVFSFWHLIFGAKQWAIYLAPKN